MEIKFVEGSGKHIPECANALKHSKLGEIYFEIEDSAITEISAFVELNTLLVAIDENQNFIGFVCYILNGAFHSFPYLHIITIAEKERNKGYGTKVMDLFEKQMFMKHSKIFLVVADFNPSAKAFYENRGYKQVGAIPDLYRTNIVEYLMMKER